MGITELAGKLTALAELNSGKRREEGTRWTDPAEERATRDFSLYSM
jgi:hypothetical protein